MRVGRYTYGHRGITVHHWGEPAELIIGSFCSIASNVHVFLGGSHRTDRITTYPFGHIHQDIFNTHDGSGHPVTNGNVIIGNDVWLGHGATIMSGIRVGDGAVVAAMAHVVKDVPPYAIVGGNPARVIRHRFPPETIQALLSLQWWNWSDERIRRAVPLLCSDDIQALVRFSQDLH